MKKTIWPLMLIFLMLFSAAGLDAASKKKKKRQLQKRRAAAVLMTTRSKPRGKQAVGKSGAVKGKGAQPGDTVTQEQVQVETHRKPVK